MFWEAGLTVADDDDGLRSPSAKAMIQVMMRNATMSTGTGHERSAGSGFLSISMSSKALYQMSATRSPESIVPLVLPFVNCVI